MNGNEPAVDGASGVYRLAGHPQKVHFAKPFDAKAR